MNFDMKAVFRFKNGHDKTVKWVERNPKIAQKSKDTGEVVREIELSDKELAIEYRKFFLKKKEEGKPISLNDIDGTVHIIDVNEVYDITLNIQVLKS